MRKLRPLLVALVVTSPFHAALAFAQGAPAAPAPAPAPTSSPVEMTTLKLMLAKGLISQAEYDSAMHDLADSAGMRAPDQSTLVVGKWSTTFYGFIEADHIYDSTQSFSEVPGNNQVQRPPPAALPASSPSTRYAGEHGRLMFGVRNSRFGFRLKAPEAGGIRTSAQFEMDLLGQAAGNGQPGAAGAVSEGSFFNNPAVRVRHANLKIETPILDILVGQYWHLFGWQSVFHPNTVTIQGVPGQIYGRTPQIRLSKTLKFGDIQLEIAAAALRPPQRDSEVPDLQGGVRVAYNGWNGMTTAGSAGTSLMPVSLAVTGDWRRFSVQEFSVTPTHSTDHATTAIALDAFIPVIPATKDKKGNSLSLNGEVVSGYGIADLYTGFASGLTNPVIPGAAQPPSNVDGNLVVYGPDGQLHGIQWTSYLIGVQYYLPGLDGRYWISANYSHTRSSNTTNFVRNFPQVAPIPTDTNLTYAGLVRQSEDWWDVNLFGDVAPGVRIGLEYANFNDKYADTIHAINHRVQASGFFLF